MTTEKYNLECFKGDELAFQFIWYQVDGVTPLNLTGYTFVGYGKEKESDTAHAFDLAITVTPLTGRVDVVLAKATTATLKVTSPACGNLPFYQYWIVATPPSGATDTCMFGELSIYGR